jgi:osmotically-inducible protein OsmY
MKAIHKWSAIVLAGALLAFPALMYGSGGQSGPQTLTSQVRHELLMLPYYNVFDNLTFSVNNGTVTLSGEVTQPYMKDDAQHAVEHLAGVKNVKNEIEVLPLSTMDNWIRWRTYIAIYGYGPLQRYALGVQPSIRIIVKNGNITLQGVVDNKTDRQLAYMRANSVPGVFSVTDDLRVVHP